MSDALDVTAKIPRDFESEPTLEGDEPRTIPIEKIELVSPPRAARGTRPLPLALTPRAATVPPPIPPHARRARTTTAALPLVAPPEEPRPAAAADEPLIEISVDEPPSGDDLAAASLGDRASKTVIVHRPPLRARVGGWLHAVTRAVRRSAPGRDAAPAPVAMPIGSVPAGATVTVISDGEVRIVGQTPLAVALDPARTYDVVLALRDHATTLHQLKPHIAAALMVRLERR